jgi:hypothetical protein
MGPGGRWRIFKVGRVEFECGLLNDLTLPPVVQGQVYYKREAVVFLEELIHPGCIFFFLLQEEPSLLCHYLESPKDTQTERDV